MDNLTEKEIITFPKGLPGFEAYKKFELAEEKDSPIAYLNSSADKDIGFVLFKPHVTFADYLTKVELDEEETEILQVKEDDQVDVWLILTLCLSDMAKTTANLRAPIIVNSRTQKGIQLILGDEKYSSRHPLFADDAGFREQSRENGKEGARG